MGPRATQRGSQRREFVSADSCAFRFVRFCPAADGQFAENLAYAARFRARYKDVRVNRIYVYVYVYIRRSREGRRAKFTQPKQWGTRPTVELIPRRFTLIRAKVTAAFTFLNTSRSANKLNL